jgi:hypothetical protein
LFIFRLIHIDYVGPVIVGYKLGMYFDWLHRAPFLAISLLIL